MLDQIERTRIAQLKAETALAKLVDQAVSLGIHLIKSRYPDLAAEFSIA